MTGVCGMVVTFAFLTVLFYGVAVWMDRQKVNVVSSDSNVNLNYARAKKNLWKNLWLCMAWVNTAFTVAMVLFFVAERSTVVWFLGGSILYTLACLGGLIFVWKKSMNLDAQYEARRDIDSVEDDGAWIWGMFYYNKNDSHTMVNKRVGIGTTTNMATPAGKLCVVTGAVCVVFVVAVCVWMILEEFTPTKLAVLGDTLVAEHLRVEYEIPLDDIEEITLQGETPTWSKVSGTAADNLCKGTFHIRNVGDCEVFLNPQNDLFIQIEAEGGTYYMSADDDEKTQQIYDEIVAKMP